MTKHECLFGYIEATRFMLHTYGVPQELYPDRLGVFFVNNKNPTIEEQLTGKKPLTQFGKMMDELGVDMYPAYSPQAKGRIEHFWQTIKSRLPVEFAIRGIKTVEEANNFLPKFMQMFAKRFGVKPVSSNSAFVSVEDQTVITKLLAVKIERKTNSAGIISIMNYKFIIPECIQKKVTVCMSQKDGIYALSSDGKKHQINLLSTENRHTQMPEVWKKLIDEYFLKNAKGKYRDVYIEAS